ncbi:MAG: amidase family protein [Gammaproteobacteria bacterium]|nr:amidase family protein [Gammaproteobacteria bacterium]
MNRSTRRTFLQQASTVAGTALLGGLTGAARAQSTSELGFMSAVDLAAKLRNKEIGSEELARYFISRIERYDEKLNAVVVRDFDRALDAAKEADKKLARGQVGGPLYGLPMTIKESYDIAGLPSTWGVPEAAQNIAQADSVVVERLKNAGALFLGKTNVPINLGDFQSYNEIYGTTNNPWDLTRTPGGSSGGSATALAAGLTGLDSGSDIGGSIRNPSHFCGTYGHKPTLGIVPSRGQQPPGVPPGAQHPDLAVVGPMARSAEDLALAMEIVAGADILTSPGWRLELPPPRMASLRGLRVALWADDPVAPVDSEISTRVHEIGERLDKLGATVSDSARPGFAAQVYNDTYLGILQGIMSGPASDLKFFDYQVMHGRRGHFRTEWQRFFHDWDVLICPTTATTAFVQDQSDINARTINVNGHQQPYFQQVFWAGLATLSYLPSTVFPTGLSERGLPIGLQAMGAEFDDRTTIEFARLLAREIGGYQSPDGYV